MRILVTGATGFVGRFLCPVLTARGHQVTAAVRHVPEIAIEGAEKTIVVGDIGPDTDWSEALSGQAAIIHLAGRSHVMNDRQSTSEALYHKVNVVGTSILAEAAVKEGIRKFIFLSSVKAMAERSKGEALTETTPPRPEDAYGRTKLEAEQALLKVASSSAMTVVNLRTPLVYGPGVKANLLRLITACDQRLPLFLESVSNKRSLVFLGNLTDALACVVEAEGLSTETFLVSDGEAVSTPELIRRISKALGRAPRLLPVPVWALTLAGTLTGKSQALDRLTGSLVIDDRKLRDVVGWTPPFNMLQGLNQTAEWFFGQESD